MLDGVVGSEENRLKDGRTAFAVFPGILCVSGPFSVEAASHGRSARVFRKGILRSERRFVQCLLDEEVPGRRKRTGRSVRGKTDNKMGYFTEQHST